MGGVGLQHFLPTTLTGLGWAYARQLIGKGLMAAGIVLALCCVALFLLRRTTLIPFGSASQLLTCGPYRFSRNPMYVSLVLVYFGVAVSLAQLCSLLLLPLPVAAIQTVVIPFEESRMQSLFGNDFVEYCARVRRWL